MSFPLGSRHVPTSRKVRRIFLRPPADEYIVNVNVPPHVSDESPPGAHSASVSPSRGTPASGGLQIPPPTGSAANVAKRLRDSRDYSECASNCLMVHLNVTDSVRVAIEKILSAFARQRGKDLPRPADHYMICRCFADFSIDFSHRGFHGDLPQPLQGHLDFPYFLSLQVIPYQLWRDEIVYQREPLSRRAIVASQRLFGTFVSDYAALLRSLHAQRQFLIARDAEARRQKQELERVGRNEALQRMMFREERSTRSSIVAQEEALGEQALYHARYFLHYLWLTEDAYRVFLEEAERSYQQLCQHMANEALHRTLDLRLCALSEVRLRLFDDMLERHRASYTEARVASHLKVAQEVDDDVELITHWRVQFTKSVSPEVRYLPEIANRSVLCGDPFTYSRSSSDAIGIV